MEFCSSEYILILGKDQVLELVNTNVICLFLRESIDSCRVERWEHFIPISLLKGWLLWFPQDLKEGRISLASTVPLKQDTARMLRLLLRRVFSLDPVRYYIEANMKYSLLLWYCVCYLWVFYTVLYEELTQVPVQTFSSKKTRGMDCGNSWRSVASVLGNKTTVLCHDTIFLYSTPPLQPKKCS